jgi:adenylate cyclase
LTALHVVIFKLRVFVPLFSCLLIWILHYLIQGAFAYQREQKDRRFITKAFSRYVSPHVLKELIQQPEKLTLGGTNKNVTVMFTDLVGFTQLSEKLKAEEIALLLQQYLTIMTDIIVKHGGTLDKYIGDAIMAFWGAPIADDKQSEHALCAAIEMQQACDQFTYGAIRNIQMRIGIHRGDAIVGNMGSDNLFDYTCIGDVVNTAARLESINKQYGTRVMLSETVKNQLRSNHLLQVTDFVKVKGKNNPIKLYSPATSPTVSSFSEKAFQAYQQQEWLQAQEYLNQILNEEPSNSVALRFIERINALEKSPPEDDWDGSFQATEK